MQSTQQHKKKNVYTTVYEYNIRNDNAAYILVNKQWSNKAVKETYSSFYYIRRKAIFKRQILSTRDTSETTCGHAAHVH